MEKLKEKNCLDNSGSLVDSELVKTSAGICITDFELFSEYRSNFGGMFDYKEVFINGYHFENKTSDSGVSHKRKMIQCGIETFLNNNNTNYYYVKALRAIYAQIEFEFSDNQYNYILPPFSEITSAVISEYLQSGNHIDDQLKCN